VNRKLIIYLDTCCYSSLFDGKISPEVIAEADRIRHIIRNRKKGGYNYDGKRYKPYKLLKGGGYYGDNRRRRRCAF
jgi:hypothetical protein